MSEFEPITYKLKLISNWNTVANKYHNNWAQNDIGPFGATEKLIHIADIQKSDFILDVGCGTGAVTKKISKKLGKKGKLIGIDISREALSIAKSEIKYSNVDFIEMDAEKIYFSLKFSKIISQFAAMFFTNPIKTLSSIRKLMAQKGMIVLGVHGLAENVPYFSCIMKNIMKFIPNLITSGSPSVHSFGDRNKLKDLLIRTGFSNVKIEKYQFSYCAGTFEEYWHNYMTCTANSIKEIIKKDNDILRLIKYESEKNALPFMENNNITFPWEILIASAYNL
jgi:ubiquinone/menaquinone biosynthesis C-methylase UbiE